MAGQVVMAAPDPNQLEALLAQETHHRLAAGARQVSAPKTSASGGAFRPIPTGLGAVAMRNRLLAMGGDAGEIPVELSNGDRRYQT